MAKALDLPELRAYVGEFLDEKDLVTCLCVCRDWHDTFKPIRWRDVRIIGIHSIRADVNLRKHAHLVRSLSFLRIISLLHFSRVDWYNQLERIHITETDIDGRRVWEKFSVLVRQNYRTLRVMILENVTPLKNFLMVLGSRGHDTERDGHEALALNSLVWKRVAVHVGNHALFWRACERAHSLVLECLTVRGIEPAPNFLDASGSIGWPPFQSSQFVMSSSTESLPPLKSHHLLLSPVLQISDSCRVRHIRVSWTIEFSLELQLFLWIRPCSQLQSLVWEAFIFGHSIMSQFSMLLRSRCWPFLTSLDITSSMATYLTDESLAMVLDASPINLERLCLKNVDFGSLAFKSLMKAGRHFESLKTLMLICCDSVTSAMARVVLESCTKLEVFHAPYLLVKDVEISDEIQNHDRDQGQELRQEHAETRLESNMEAISGQEQRAQARAQDNQDTILSPLPRPRPWVCLALHTLYIGATVPSYDSPPLTKEEKCIIRRKLKSLSKLRKYQVGASISSVSTP